MGPLHLPVLACCLRGAWAIHAQRGEPPAFSAEQRLDELDALLADGSAGEEPALLIGERRPKWKDLGMATRQWGCSSRPFRMAMPAHTGTCTVTKALTLSLQSANISCTDSAGKPVKNAGQDHDHRGLARTVIGKIGWARFKNLSSVSWVMGKDPWSRIVSSTVWLNALNTSKTPDEQISDFRQYLYKNLPAADSPEAFPSGDHIFNYLHSISEFAYAVPPGKCPGPRACTESDEEQVLGYVGSVKDISGSFRHICKLVGIPEEHCVDPSDPRVTQHRISGSSRVRTADLFDEELRGRVARIWAKDIERFGYEFGEL
jgi:hypothetical protein